MAQFNLGICYRDGVGVTQDYVEALKWFRKVAAQGAAQGNIEVGYAYFWGRGVPENKVEALKWYRLSAKQGLPFAQYVLGVCYDLGEGVPKDMVEAEKWYRLAAENGHEEAQKTLEEISGSVTSADMKSTSDILSELKKGTTKSQVKAFFGRPPDDASHSTWHYDGQFVDKDAEKIFSRCSVVFSSNDQLYLVSFFAAPR